jgi:hypothetical protein
MAVSKSKLWEAQLRHWPNSVRLTPADVFGWCDEPSTVAGKLNRYQQVAMSLQYSACVFYRIEGTTYRGIRYGTQGHQYMSLYTGEIA